jgi:sulfopyruvate decarboxylase subunit beta
VEHVAAADTLEDLDQAFTAAVDREALSVLVSKVEAVGPASFAMDIGLLENRIQFGRFLQGISSKS